MSASGWQPNNVPAFVMSAAGSRPHIEPLWSSPLLFDPKRALQE
jgi:hypothetical protein